MLARYPSSHRCLLSALLPLTSPPPSTRRGSAYHSDEEIVETLNGCVCCSVRQDLIAAI